MRVLSAINNFWTGGRETFLSEHARALAGRDVEIGLLAGSISAPQEILSAFVSCDIAHGGMMRGFQKLTWNPSTSLIWGHHYDLFTCWLLSRLHGVPLHATFHGPLLGAGSNSSIEALGMTLAIFRSEGLSGVSNEVVKTIREVLPLPRDIDVFRNATKWNLRADRDVNLPRTAHALIVSRSQKLGHLRAGFDLFARAYWSGLVKRLIIISATPPGAIPLKGRFLAASGLLGLSWCFSKGFKFLFPLLATRVVPATYPLDPFFQKAELVLGMGRVVVEGLAWGKKCVLIGYERAIDLVDADNFSSLAESNFSGRQCVALSPECIISRLANHQRPPKESDILPFQIENAAARVQAALVRDSRKAIHNRDCILAKKLAHALVEGESDAKIFRLAFQNLQPSEMECFYRLTAG